MLRQNDRMFFQFCFGLTKFELRDILLKSLSITSSIERKFTKKTFFNEKKGQELVNSNDGPLTSSAITTICSNLKRCSKIGDVQHGIRIHQQLSRQSLKNPVIQTSLIHFYSKSSIIIFSVYSVEREKKSFLCSAMSSD